MPSGFTTDPHSEQGNICPKNRFGTVDYAKLQPVELVFTLKRQGELAKKGIQGKFDTAHLQSIHRYLFQDVFPWAGELRVVNISKGNTNFGPAMHIGSALKELFESLAKENLLTGLNDLAFVERAAFYLARSTRSIPFARATGVRSASS